MRDSANAGRVLHITMYKSGSQWVAGVLGDAEVLNVVGYSRVPGLPRRVDERIDDESRVLHAPVYELNALEWTAQRHSGERAIVVLRDPRDCLVSWLYSMLYSHYGTPTVKLQRELLSGMDKTEARLKSLFPQIHYQVRFYTTWSDCEEPDAMVLRYEDLVCNEQAEFGRIFDWLGWNLPDDRIRDVVQRHSFESRSGRKRGEVDEVSHYRRGVPADWRNHFSRTLGALWESLYPGFLSSIGYEDNDDWWHDLPDLADASRTSTRGTAQDRLNIQQRRIDLLEEELRKKEKVIQNLKAACDERLKVIHRLHEAGQSDTDNSKMDS